MGYSLRVVRARDFSMSEQTKQEQQNRNGQREIEKDRRSPPPKHGSKLGPVKIGVFGVILLAALIFGVRFWLRAQHYEETDDAYVTA